MCSVCSPDELGSHHMRVSQIIIKMRVSHNMGEIGIIIWAVYSRLRKLAALNNSDAIRHM
jgi:hypothetical protein